MSFCRLMTHLCLWKFAICNQTCNAGHFIGACTLITSYEMVPERDSTAQRAGRLMFSSLRLSVSRCSCVFLGAASWRLLRGGCSSGTMSACLLSRQLGQHVPALYHPFLTMWRCRCDHPFWKWPCMLWPSHSNPVTFEACPI